MIIRVRRRLIAAARGLARARRRPAGVDNPEAYRVRSGGAFLPQEAQLAGSHRAAGAKRSSSTRTWIRRSSARSEA